MTHHASTAEALRDPLNVYPPYVGAGILITHIARDASEIRVEMPLNDSNLNLVGTHFGGSLYALVDPHLMILLIQRLGPDYVVWDKEANIDFRKPGIGTVHATVRVTDAETEAIRAATAKGDKHRRNGRSRSSTRRTKSSRSCSRLCMCGVNATHIDLAAQSFLHWPCYAPSDRIALAAGCTFVATISLKERTT